MALLSAEERREMGNGVAVGDSEQDQGESRLDFYLKELRPVIVDLITPTIVFSVAYAVDCYMEPYHRNVSDYKNGPDISLPVKDSIVSDELLVVLAFILPLLVISAVCLSRKGYAELARGIVALTEAFAVSTVLTTVGKKACGQLRPCFLAYCQWDGSKCLAGRMAAMDSRQSFPSGHGSGSGAGLGFLTLFLNRALTSSTSALPHTATRPISLIPLVLALLIGVSRTVDNHHRVEDVAMGLFIGVASAAAIFRCHYRLYPVFTVAPARRALDADV